jgi:hypothetical protein
MLAITNGTAYLSTALFGNYSVRLLVDSFHQVIETNKTDNDIQLGVIYVRKRESDLAVTNITAPRSAYSGNQISLWWRVQNVGNMAASNQVLWRDDVTLLAGGSRVASLSHVLISLPGPLLPQQMYTQQVNVSIPSGLAGTYDLQVTTANYVVSGGQEPNSANNIRATSITLMTPPSPDFKPVSCSYELSTVSAVRLMSVSCSVTNIGNSMTSANSWTDHLSLINSVNVETVGSDKRLTENSSRARHTLFSFLLSYHRLSADFSKYAFELTYTMTWRNQEVKTTMY